MGLWDLDQTIEREQIKETVDEQLEEQDRKESCLSLESVPKPVPVILKPPGLRKRKNKKVPEIKIGAKNKSQTSLDEIVKADELDEETQNRKESVVTGDLSASKEIDEFSADVESSHEESEFNMIYSVMMAPTLAKESYVPVYVEIIVLYNITTYF